MKDGRIYGYLDTKHMRELWIEQILHNFKDQKIANFFLPQTGKFSRGTRQMCQEGLGRHMF